MGKREYINKAIFFQSNNLEKFVEENHVYVGVKLETLCIIRRQEGNIPK